MLFYELLLILVWAYFFASLASFFGVVIFRTSRERSYVSGPSACEHCQHQLSWYDNLPLYSFVALGGRCRYCQHKIDASYWWMEVLAFGAAVTFGLLSDWSLSSLLVFLVWFTLSFVLWSDLKYLLIPDFFVLLLTILSLVWLWATQLHPGWQLLSAATATGFFVIIYILAKKILGKEALGLGDIKLMLPLALLLPWPLVLVHIFMAFILGGIFAMLMLSLRVKKFGQVLPFAPFLILAFVLSWHWGELLWHWYWGFLL